MAKYEVLADTQNKISLWQKFNARTQSLFQDGVAQLGEGFEEQLKNLKSIFSGKGGQ